jgi:hypothetical protein
VIIRFLNTSTEETSSLGTNYRRKILLRRLHSMALVSVNLPEKLSIMGQQTMIHLEIKLILSLNSRNIGHTQILRVETSSLKF